MGSAQRPGFSPSAPWRGQPGHPPIRRKWRDDPRVVRTSSARGSRQKEGRVKVWQIRCRCEEVKRPMMALSLLLLAMLAQEIAGET